MKNILTILLFVILVIVLFFFTTSRLSIILGIRSYDILSGSMEPIIPTGGLVISKPSNGYQIGDIITFTRGNIVVTHRIAAIKNYEFVTKGDANKIADSELLNKKDVIGKVFFIIPYLGIFIGFLKTVFGFILFIVLPTLAFVAFEILEIKKEIEKTTEERVKKLYEAQLKNQYEQTTI